MFIDKWPSLIVHNAYALADKQTERGSCFFVLYFCVVCSQWVKYPLFVLNPNLRTKYLLYLFPLSIIILQLKKIDKEGDIKEGIQSSSTKHEYNTMYFNN